MSMPTWDELMAPLLRVMSDGHVLRLRELREATAAQADLTTEQLAELLPSGQAKADNRIGWAASYLTRVGALQRPARGQYVITDVGRDLLAAHPNGITESDLRALVREGDEWWLTKRSAPDPSATAIPPPMRRTRPSIQSSRSRMASPGFMLTWLPISSRACMPTSRPSSSKRCSTCSSPWATAVPRGTRLARSSPTMAASTASLTRMPWA